MEMEVLSIMMVLSQLRLVTLAKILQAHMGIMPQVVMVEHFIIIAMQPQPYKIVALSKIGLRMEMQYAMLIPLMYQTAALGAPVATEILPQSAVAPYVTSVELQ